MPMRSRRTKVATVAIVRQGRDGRGRAVEAGPSRGRPGAPTTAATAGSGSADRIAAPGDEKSAPQRENQATKDSDVHSDHRRQIVANVPATFSAVTARSRTRTPLAGRA